MRAWELTANASYINRTHIIFEHQVDVAWNASSCLGGVMWQGYIYSEKRWGNPYKGAITNELFLMITAKMAVLGPPETRGRYAEWAQRAWAWFQRSGLIGEKGLINDGLDTFVGHEDICRNNNQTAWTYNQGVILGGLGYLWELTADDGVLETAATIINATLTHLVHSSASTGSAGVLKEPCEGGWMAYQECSQDAVQFKGVFIRYLGMLLDLVKRRPAAAKPLGILAAQHVKSIFECKVLFPLGWGLLRKLHFVQQEARRRCNATRASYRRTLSRSGARLHARSAPRRPLASR